MFLYLHSLESPSPPRRWELKAWAMKTEAPDIVRWKIDQAFVKTDKLFLDLAKKILIDALENDDLNMDKSFIHRVVRNDL